MAIYLVQHGKSLPKESDPDQGLSEEGRNAVHRTASVAKDYGVQISGIVHSGKTRARQTAEIFSQAIGLNAPVSQRDGLKPLDDVTASADAMRTGDNLMLVGHLPFMEKLTAHLVCGNAENLVFKFQNGGIVCLDEAADGRGWFIKWALMPNID